MSLQDRYELGALRREGARLAEYDATDRTLGRPVSVVRLRSEAAQGAADRARFEEVARTLAGLHHPHLVGVHDIGPTEEAYLVRERVDGLDLAEVVGQRLHPSRVSALAAQLAAALEHAHAAGVVHGHLDASSVVLGDDGRARIADLGLAELDRGATAAPVPAAEDVHALGLLLLTTLTGRRAAPGQAVPGDLPPGWDGLVEAMLRADPSTRPTAADVRARAEELAEGVDLVEATQAIRLGDGALDAPTAVMAPIGQDVADEPARRPAPAPAPAPAPESPRRTGRVVAALVALLLVAGAVVGAVILLDRPGGPPDDVPPQLRSELRDLHDAVNGE